MNNEQLKDELKAEFEKWYAELLSKAPDIVPYRAILFHAFISGAIFATDLNVRQLGMIFSESH